MPAGFRDIADQLRRKIEDGDYAPGTRIPTEHELADQHGLSRETIRRALALLKAEGLLTSATSRGTYVSPRPVRLTIARYSAVLDSNRDLRSLGPWETACAHQGIEGRTQVVSVIKEPASSALANRLGVPAGTDLIHRKRYMWAGDHIAQVQDAWMPAPLVDGTVLAESEKVVGGVYAAMTQAGFSPDSVSEEISGRSPTSDERAQMQLSAGTFVLEVWRTTRDATGQITEILRTVADARRATFIYDDLPIRRSEG